MKEKIERELRILSSLTKSNWPWLQILTLAISLASPFVAYQIGVGTQKVQLADQARQTLIAYTAEYARLVEACGGNPFTATNFSSIPQQYQVRVEILAGLLAMAIDLMNKSGDEDRAKIWSNYLSGFSGPLAKNYPLESWVTHSLTKQAIQAAKQDALQAALVNKPSEIPINCRLTRSF